MFVLISRTKLLEMFFFRKTIQFLPKKILELFQENHDAVSPQAHFDMFDTLVFENELLKRGILCEVCGPPGAGKTQFLFQLCSSYLLSQEESNETIIYIDTENNFNPQRLHFNTTQ